NNNKQTLRDNADHEYTVARKHSNYSAYVFDTVSTFWSEDVGLPLLQLHSRLRGRWRRTSISDRYRHSRRISSNRCNQYRKRLCRQEGRCNKSTPTLVLAWTNRLATDNCLSSSTLL